MNHSTLGNSIALYADLLANQEVDELVAQGRMLFPREEYVKEKRHVIAKCIGEETVNSMQKQMQLGQSLHAALQKDSSLSQEQKDAFLLQMLQSTERSKRLQEKKDVNAGDIQALSADTMQEFIGFSQELVDWMYRVAQQYIDQNAYPEASQLFHYLTILNGNVYEYWFGLGLSLQAQAKNEEALHAFAIVNVLDPNFLPARYASALIYCVLNEKEEAKAELDLIQRAVQDNNLTNFQPFVDDIQKRLSGGDA